jgi:tRNA threonylcarbamoyl adenosine modification protein YeaZ
MKNLIIDCSAGMSIYVVCDNNIFSFVDENEKRHTDDLLVALDKLLLDAKLKINDIENICVCVGPGSFTGVRVAISICKGLAIGSGAKVFVISNFDCYATHEEKKIIVLEGFSKLIYTRKVFAGSSVDVCEDIEEFAASVKEKYADIKIYVPNEKVQNMLKKHEINSIIAQNDAIFAFNQKIKSDEKIDLNQISPVYLRASQAEIERDKKLKGIK